MGNIVLGLELLASGGAATVGEIKKVQQATKEAKAESVGASAATAEGNQKAGFSVTELASKYFLVVQALQAVLAVGKTVYGSLIEQNVQLQEQLLGTQTSLASTNKVFAGGIELTDPTAAIQALEGPVNDAVARLRKGSLDLVGVTSAELIPLFQNIAGQSSAIGANLTQSADLSLKFAAALGTFKIPLEQQRQEVSSILQANITQDSILAKNLNITNAQVLSWKANGTAVAELNKRLEAAAAGNKLAAQTIGGIGSNIKEIFDNVTLAAGKPLTEEITKDLGQFYKFLVDNQDAIQSFVSEGADLILGLVQNFKEFGAEAGTNLQPVFEQLAPIVGKLAPIFELVVVGLEKLIIKGSELIEQNIALKVFLATADAVLTLVQALGQLNGDYAAGTEAAEVYGQRSSAIAQEAVDALGKQARGEAGATAAKKEAIAKINDQLKALKESNLSGAENRAVIKSQVAELELYKGKLEGAGGAIKLVSKDTTQLTSDLKLLTEGYEKQGAAVGLAQAQLIAAVKRSQVATGDEAVTSAREAQAQVNQIEQQGLQEKLKLAQAQEDGIRAIQAKGGNEDQQKEFAKNLVKIQTEAATLEGQIADKAREGKKQILDRQLKDLEVYQAKANDAIATSESALLLQAEQGYQRDLTQKQLYELKKLGIAQARIEAEIAAEEERTKTLQKLTFSDPDEKEANEAKIRASKQKTASLTLKALENQRQIEQSIAEIQIKQINDRAALEKRNNDEHNRQLGQEKNAIEAITQSLERQGKLRTAQNDLAKAQISLLETGATIQTSGLDRALELRKKLNDQTTDPAVARVLRQQLEALTGDRNTSEVEILRRKFALENSISSLKAIALTQEQDAARNALKIEAQRNELAAKRAIIEARIAEINSRTALIEAKKNLADLKKTPGADPTAIADAAQAVKDAQSNVGLATGNVQSAIGDLEQQKTLAPLAERTLAAQQASARAQQQAAEYARQQAAQLTIVEAKSQAIAAGNFRDKFTPEDFAPIRPPTIQVPSARETAQFIRTNGAGAISPQPSQITVPPTNTAVLEAKADELIKINRDLALRLLQQERNTFSQTNYYGQKSGVLRGSGL
jgi:hypothetical protein